LPTISYGQEIRLFNPKVFGKSVERPITQLIPSETKNAILPMSIQIDIENGKYFAATITYSKKTPFLDIQNEIKKHYPKASVKSFGNGDLVVFRNEEEKFAIQVDNNDCNIQAIYVPFVSTERILQSVKKVLKHLEKQ